jgi:hypothetical protein
MEQLIENSHRGFAVQKPACIGPESYLSRNMHWGCSHVYDETPVGLAVYVRNDPINMVDPNGKEGIPFELGYLAQMGWTNSEILKYQSSLPYISNGYQMNPFDSYYFYWEANVSAFYLGGNTDFWAAAHGWGGGISSLGIASAMESAVNAQSKRIFTTSMLTCISGIETGETWNPNIVAKNGRVGLFQFDQQNWIYSGTSIAWDNGNSAKDPETASLVTLALLYRKLGTNGIENPTESAITSAIDRFGEGDGKYGAAVMNCSKALDAGDLGAVHTIINSYATSK